MNRRMFSFLTKLKEYHKSILKIWGLRTNYCEMPHMEYKEYGTFWNDSGTRTGTSWWYITLILTMYFRYHPLPADR